VIVALEPLNDNRVNTLGSLFSEDFGWLTPQKHSLVCHVQLVHGGSFCSCVALQRFSELLLESDGRSKH
jgi:hypothetical protein